ncbi:unnamed protein product [Rotaria sordida]|uniref:B30.2/SPRY domain-containing protein n=1 Tax=Rotaria sordida TaxID=392033 RepID=A0A815N2U6_9BILA|nr:unnamed protein product [Rotaria sordida]CAF1431231.1 unnamed protein product [Rotaria sordida]CAF3954424.1 unnamed protein product [Rotaria sordida]
MASVTSKTPCVTCGKGAGLFKCEGCTQTFCTKHVAEHRQTLHHQLDEIIVKHDSLQEKIIENKDQSNPLIKYVDEWEQKSIVKIQQMAEETRQKVVKLSDIHKRTVSKELNLLTEQIKKAREEDDFIETDLIYWISTLNRMRDELITVPLSNNIKEDQSAPLIYQLKLTTTSSEFDDKSMFQYRQAHLQTTTSGDILERCLDGAKIGDNGQLVEHSDWDCPVEVRGKVGYTSGTHRFRLQIEKNPRGTWIFFGIISKTQLMTKCSYESSSAYGWADYDDYFLGGVRQNNQNTGQFYDTVESDIITLIVDCTNRKICYVNEKRQKSQQLDININKCPFPWQLHINLYGTGDRVRLLSATSNISLSSYQ